LSSDDQRSLLDSKEFSKLFLDDTPGLEIHYQELAYGEKIGSGGFKDCFKGKVQRGHDVVYYCLCVEYIYN
jgi:hypothetical protein